MNKYRDKSDFEINVRIANILLKYGQVANVMHINEDVLIFDKNSKCSIFNPCNNPADAMPIIIENGISSLFNDDEWICSVPYTEFLSINESLYRAAMEAFLMMKDAESEK
ncbi:phage protein NinX family protein [Morganella morganii]|uniref:phage protein NinX family protein n=1 Tax=Morganella morganii TaxID=582 RepID=UPI001BD42029|nr:phage protein NinX family protein [Morganella morganii]